MDRAETITRLKSAETRLRALGVGSLYLFGSTARNEGDDGSDVDVFVDPSDRETFGLNGFIGSYEILRDLLGDQIDYGTREGLSKYIRAQVESEAEKVF